MTIRAAYVVAPVFAASEVVAFLFARMTGKTRLGDFLGRLVLERNDFCGVAFFGVGLSRAMTRFAAGDFVLPGVDGGETSVRRMREGCELIFVASFAGIVADVIVIR